MLPNGSLSIAFQSAKPHEARHHRQRHAVSGELSGIVAAIRKQVGAGCKTNLTPIHGDDAAFDPAP